MYYAQGAAYEFRTVSLGENHVIPALSWSVYAIFFALCKLPLTDIFALHNYDHLLTVALYLVT